LFLKSAVNSEIHECGTFATVQCSERGKLAECGDERRDAFIYFGIDFNDGRLMRLHAI